MAEKKMVKKVKDVDEVKTIDQLREDLANLLKDQNEAKRGHKLGELANPRFLTLLRKKIARVHTAIRAAEIEAIKENK